MSYGTTNATLCNVNYIVLIDFCYGEFLAYYTLENKSSQICEYLPDELDDDLIENNHEVKLVISGKTSNNEHDWTPECFASQ